MLCMLIAKLPGGLIDRWSRNVQAIRKRHLHTPDLQDLINFVEEETVLMNDPLFSREEALHESTPSILKSTRIQQDDYTVTRQRTRNLQMRLRLTSNCAGIGKSATNLGEVISMWCCVCVIKTLQLGQGSVNICLITCSQGTFVTDDLLKKLGLSGVRTSINIKTLNDN